MGSPSICTNAMTRVLATVVCSAGRRGITCETGSPTPVLLSRYDGLYGSPNGPMVLSAGVIFIPRETPAAKHPANQG